MSKAILVLENMPKCCDECPLYNIDYKVGWCKGIYKRTGVTNVHSEKANWCPLKPLPKKRYQGYTYDEYIDGCNFGYNFCIDEILGGCE